ncbi:MAG: hypothetical protein FWF55_04590 [Treponema sp.]|nr:hypothetical protein [Treponema sp.]
MKKRGIAVGVLGLPLALVLFAFLAPQELAARQIVDSKIKIGEFYPYARAGAIIAQNYGPYDDPKTTGPVVLNDGTRRYPNYPKNGEGEAILGNIKSIKTRNHYVEIMVSQDADLFKPGGNRRLFIIQKDTQVDFNQEKNGKTGFILISGSIMEDKDFKTAVKLDDVMNFYAAVYDVSGEKISKYVEDMRSKYKTSDDLAEAVIKDFTTKSAALGSLFGLAPIWLIPGEFAFNMAQNLDKARMAYTLKCVYGEKYKYSHDAWDDLKYDLYVLFADDDVQVTLRNIASQTGGDSKTEKAVTVSSEVLSKASVLRKIGGTKVFQSTVMKAMPAKVTSKLTAKGVAKRVPIISALVNGGIDAKEASNFGKQAKAYYRQ